MYALFRVVDELADNARVQVRDRDEALARVTSWVERVAEPGFTCDAPWFPAVRGVYRAFPVAVDDTLRLIAACRADANGATYASMGELEAYAAGVGGAVLRLAMPILGPSDVDSLERAERLGIGLHLIDIVRDVEEDRQLGRCYLPLEYAGEEDRGVACIVRRARECCREAAILARRIPNDGSRIALLVTADLYESMLDGPLTRARRFSRVARCILRAYL